ncbi:MAG TPA: hypothetical protein VGQ31_02335 [Candidatus Limnocylindrales bacterium]|nr:hypothetical protein [Candidatus Limnocylindrales bacterium]
MSDDALAEVLRLVADGRLTAEEAAPILDALELASRGAGASGSAGSRDEDPGPVPAADGRPARALRVQVSDNGRSVLNLRIPLSVGRAAFAQIPGISQTTSDRISEAIAAGVKGPIVDLVDGADGVRISIE